MKKGNQTLDIKKYLETHKKGITQKIAWDNFGASRLSGIIFRLKREPYHMNIVTFEETQPNRYGGMSRVACYKLVD